MIGLAVVVGACVVVVVSSTGDSDVVGGKVLVVGA